MWVVLSHSAANKSLHLVGLDSASWERHSSMLTTRPQPTLYSFTASSSLVSSEETGVRESKGRERRSYESQTRVDISLQYIAREMSVKEVLEEEIETAFVSCLFRWCFGRAGSLNLTIFGGDVLEFLPREMELFLPRARCSFHLENTVFWFIFPRERAWRLAYFSL